MRSSCLREVLLYISVVKNANAPPNTIHAMSLAVSSENDRGNEDGDTTLLSLL